jgi:hypothetical protein
VRSRSCPRTHAGAFPRAWDSFGHANRPRPATRRELEILKALLQESLAGAAQHPAATSGGVAPSGEVAAGSFNWSLTYLLGELSPWLLLAVGVGFLVPVAASTGRDPESRFYPRARRAYIAWGTVVYLLGLILAVQVDEVWHYAH